MYNSIKTVLVSQLQILTDILIVGIFTKGVFWVPHGGSRPSKSAQSGTYGNDISDKCAALMTWVVCDNSNFCTVIPRLTKISPRCFWTRLTNMDSANECFSGCAR